jgi:predicted esterase
MPAARSEEARAGASAGELSARPQQTRGRGEPGLRQLEDPLGRSALLYVPKSYRAERPAPLVVMLHGAGGTAQHSIDLARPYADRLGFILLAPQSRAASWDIISARAYGRDVAAIDRDLEQVFADYAVDPARVAVAGFSDGASYALSIGIINGALFRHILAFSPGFMAPTRAEGSPRIFVSHGVQDRVLPIDRCSRRLVPALKRSRFEVDYVEFPDGHIVPPDLAARAFARLGPGKGQRPPSATAS